MSSLQTELEHTIAPVYSSLRNVYWGWFWHVGYYGYEFWCMGCSFPRIGIGWGDLYVSMHKHQLNNQMGFFQVNWDNNYAGVNVCNKILANTAIASNEDIVSVVRAYRTVLLQPVRPVQKHSSGYNLCARGRMDSWTVRPDSGVQLDRRRTESCRRQMSQ